MRRRELRRAAAQRQAAEAEAWRPLWSLQPEDPELQQAMGAIGRGFGFTVEARLVSNDAGGDHASEDQAPAVMPLAAGAENLTLWREEP